MGPRGFKIEQRYSPKAIQL
ncbi:hypothetical protein CCACVL1_05514 [Corchorus capsularis]|uniref:Uncharacterized protein n=1 Tax=Corchorus capsularis TaxID=210143 RepID=A0A1R3JK26_COCAP|nr:hypothetical protein CCACVL1_05514 [Corchorus capsularis]